MDDLQVFQVLDEVLNISDKWLGACVALFNLRKMVVTYHSIDESGDEFGITLKVEAVLFEPRLEWHKSLDSGSSVLSGVEIGF